MANALVLQPHAFSVAGLYAGVTAAGAPANLANDYAGVIWRSAPGNEVLFFLDLGADVAVDGVAWLGVRGAPADATMAISLATQAQGMFTGGSWQAGVPLFAGSERLPNGAGIGFWERPVLSPPPAKVRYVALHAHGLAAAALEYGRFVVGQRVPLTRNFGFGGAFGVRDFGSTDFSSRAVLLRRRGSKLRTVGLSFSHVHRDEVEAGVQPLLEQIGATDPMFLCTDPAAHAMRERRCYYGPLIGDLGTIWRNSAAWEWRANLVSLF